MNRICFWGSDFTKIGGISRVVTVIANKIIDKYEVTYQKKQYVIVEYMK